jgi:DNA-binding transcriptional LysR family regulator
VFSATIRRIGDDHGQTCYANDLAIDPEDLTAASRSAGAGGLPAHGWDGVAPRPRSELSARKLAARAARWLGRYTEDLVSAHIAQGRLERVLTRWCPAFSGYHLYYPSRRQSSPASQLLWTRSE